MLLYIREILIKVVFTVLALTIYIVLLYTPMPGFTFASSNTTQVLDLVQMSDIINGTKRYSILGLNIMPLITSLIITRFSVIGVTRWSKKYKALINHRDMYSQFSNRLFIVSLIVMSIIEGILYIFLIVKRGDYILINGLLDNAVYCSYYVFIIVCGSLVVTYLVKMINHYGIGKGIYCITLTNFIIVIYNLLESYLLLLPKYMFLIVLLQCLLCTLVYYYLDRTVITVPTVNRVHLANDFNNLDETNIKEYLALNSIVGLLPLIYTHTFFYLIVRHTQTLYGMVLIYMTQAGLLLIFYTLLKVLPSSIEKTMQNIAKKTTVLTNINKNTYLYILFSVYERKLDVLRITFLLSIMFVSEMLVIIFLIIDTSVGVINSSVDLWSLFYINNICMFMFLLCIRLLLLIYYSTDIYKIHSYCSMR